jgi:hypothetical protein
VFPISHPKFPRGQTPGEVDVRKRPISGLFLGGDFFTTLCTSLVAVGVISILPSG